MGQLYLGSALAGRHESTARRPARDAALDRELGGWWPDAAVVGVNPLSLRGLRPHARRAAEASRASRSSCAPTRSTATRSSRSGRSTSRIRWRTRLVQPYFLGRDAAGRARCDRSVGRGALDRGGARAAASGLARELVAHEPFQHRSGTSASPTASSSGRARGRYRFGGHRPHGAPLLHATGASTSAGSAR